MKPLPKYPLVKHFDYKDTVTLKHFLNPHGRLLPRKHTGLGAVQQEQLELAVKRARFMGLLPYVME